MAQAMPVMTLTQDFDPDELPVLKLQRSYDDDSTERLEIPIIDGRTVEANLYGLNEFFEAAKELTYDTGDELFSLSQSSTWYHQNRLGHRGQ
jgi:hypothetical protein